MKHIVKTLCLILALCLVVAPLAGCASHKRPLSYVKSSLERTIERSVLGEVLSVVLSSLGEGTLDLSVSGGIPLAVSTPLISRSALMLRRVRSRPNRCFVRVKRILMPSFGFQRTVPCSPRMRCWAPPRLVLILIHSKMTYRIRSLSTAAERLTPRKRSMKAPPPPS